MSGDKNPNWKGEEAVKRGRLRGRLRKFGLTVEQYEDMVARQGGVCAICDEKCSVYERLTVDHDHDTGQVRGLLCTHCNTGLGKFADDPERLRAAAEYLTKEGLL